ncbi:hypothetical protein ACVILL_001964 [Bradyrhizobium sp. USDA 3364]
MSVLPPGADMWTGRFAPILLKKAFWGEERKFPAPLMRLIGSDVRDHIASSKIDHVPP